MPRRAWHPTAFVILTLMVGLVAFVPRLQAGPLAAAAPSPSYGPPVPRPAEAVASWLVTLEGASVFERYAAAEGLNRPGARQRDADTTAVRASRIASLLSRFDDEVRRRQAPIVAAVEASGARVVSRYTTAANGLLLHATAAQARAVARLDGVERIELAPLVRPMLGQSVPHIGATALAAELGYDGSDSVVAVIDTGVDYTHAHLGGPGTVEAFQAASALRETITDTWQGEPLYPNAKVIGGWDFVGPRYNPPHICSDAMMANDECTNEPEPDADPLDGASHGTHVAGISAGVAVANLADGVAPGATLVGLKLYGRGGADEAADLLVDAIEWVARVNLGLEDRGVLPPKVDAVNISLGEAQAIASHLFDDAVAAAVGAGAIVVASAGNAGDRPYVLGSPSASPRILSVASSLPPSVYLEVQADWRDDAGAAQQEGLPAIESSIALPLAQVEPLPLVAPLAWFGRACADDEQEQEVTERIALVARGECTFREKLLRVQEAGAAGVVMFTDNRAKNAMGGDGSDIEIPAVMIDNDPGLRLVDRVTGGVAVTITIDPQRRVLDESQADAISGFSSRGPSRAGALKPDITGPGSGILSAARGSGNGGSSSSGTSMSGPHLAGAAAVVQQRNRAEELGLGAGELTALLMNYARPVIGQGDGVAPVTRQGAGRVDLMGAGTGDLLVTAGDIAGLNIGPLAADGPTRVEHELTLRNLGAEAMRVALRSELLYADDEGMGLTLGLPRDPVLLSPGEVLEVPVVVTLVPEALAPWRLLGAAGADTAAVQRAEIDGYVLLSVVDEEDDPIADVPAVSVPFRALPRRASRIVAQSPVPLTLPAQSDMEPGALDLANRSPFTGTTEVFLLPFDVEGKPAGFDPDEPEVPLELDLRAVGVRFEPPTSQQPAGSLSFGLALHEVAAIPQQAVTEILLDTDDDGVPNHRIRAAANGDRMVTRYAAWDAATGAITGTEETTGTLHVADLHGRVEMLSVPLTAVGLDGPAPIAFSVLRRGQHEDWRHVGLPDTLPDATARDTTDAWRHWRVAPEDLSRVPSRWTLTVAGDERLSLPLSLTDDGAIDPELLLLYPSNDFAPEAGWAGGQVQHLRPGPSALHLPFLLAEHSLGAD